MDNREHAALVSGFDQRLSHRRSGVDADTTGGLYPLQWFRLRRNAKRAGRAGRSIRAPAFFLPRLRTRRRIHRARACFAKNLGDRDAPRLWSERTWTVVKTAHANDRPLTHPRRTQT